MPLLYEGHRESVGILAFFAIENKSNGAILDTTFTSCIDCVLNGETVILSFSKPRCGLCGVELERLDLVGRNSTRYGESKLCVIRGIRGASDSDLSEFTTDVEEVGRRFSCVVLSFPKSFSGSSTVYRLTATKIVSVIIVPIRLSTVDVYSTGALSRVFRRAKLGALPFFGEIRNGRSPTLCNELHR